MKIWVRIIAMLEVVGGVFGIGLVIPGEPFDLGVSVPAWIFLVVLRKYKPDATSSLDVLPPPPPTELVRERSDVG